MCEHENVLEFILLERFSNESNEERENEVITCQLLEKCLKPRINEWMLSYSDDGDEDCGGGGGIGDNFKLHYDMTASDMVDQENLPY